MILPLDGRLLEVGIRRCSKRGTTCFIGVPIEHERSDVNDGASSIRLVSIRAFHREEKRLPNSLCSRGEVDEPMPKCGAATERTLENELLTIAVRRQ